MPATPADFAKRASNGRWITAPHLELLNEKLTALAEGRIRRLIVTMPPRHGKSEFCSRYFPAWYLGKYPDNRIILCSYEAEFAATWGGKARDLLDESGGEMFGVAVREDARARNDWKIRGNDGGMVTAGVGGPITGKGANILIIDDPVKNAEEAASKTYRDKTWDWWQSTAYTRLEPDASVLVIQTRWHEADLAGRLLNEKTDDEDAADERWELLNLPAIAEENDAMGRRPGEALWPARWPAKKLERRKKRLGTYFWFALYQQRPQPPGGELFNRNHFLEYTTDGQVFQLHRGENQRWAVPAKDVRRFATLDVAASEKQSADYSVLQVWGLTPSYDMLLIDQWREQKQIPQVVSESIRLCRQHDVEFIAVEKNGVGMAVMQTLRQRGLSVKALLAKGDKVMRSHTAQLRMEAGMIHFPDGAAFVTVLKEELETFPKSAHDDTVDALCWAAIVAHKLGGAIRDDGDDTHEQQQAARQADADETAKHPGTAIETPENPPGDADPDVDDWLRNG